MASRRWPIASCRSTKTVAERDMRDQLLDSMDLERERGITIKAQAVRVLFRAADERVYELNLIDTPGHVDFTYEVSRSLAACEGALLVVDAAQGIEAQTLANAYLAIENDLDIVPVVNKIDLPAADPDAVARRGGRPDRRLGRQRAADLGQDRRSAWRRCCRRWSTTSRRPRATRRRRRGRSIFDSSYDQYRGVVAFVRMVDGGFHQGDEVRAMAQGTRFDVEELGFFSPGMRPAKHLSAGEVGYIITGLKDVSQLRVGDTLTLAQDGAEQPLPGYQDVKPMVFAGLFPTDSDQYPELRDALEKLKLNDAALSYEPETSQALGFGFRCGFLGLLHMDIVRERLEREYDLDLLVTAPNVAYRVQDVKGSGRGAQPGADAGVRRRPGHRGALRAGVDHRAQGVRRAADGAEPGAARRVRAHGVPERGARAAGLRPAAGRDRARLLRPAEVAHAAATPRSTTTCSASARASWSRSTCCWPASRSTRCR